MKKDPFAGTKFRQEQTDPTFLTLDELELIMKKDFQIERLNLVKDVFVFCCFTGLAFVDAKELKQEHLYTDNNGNLWIHKGRHKIKMNSYLKEIADFCGINKNLTTYVARHTFGTTVTLANKVSIENVSKMLGHTSVRMTQHYARVLDQNIFADMQGVKSRLSAIL
jgi:integrase